MADWGQAPIGHSMANHILKEPCVAKGVSRRLGMGHHAKLDVHERTGGRVCLYKLLYSFCIDKEGDAYGEKDVR